MRLSSLCHFTPVLACGVVPGSYLPYLPLTAFLTMTLLLVGTTSLEQAGRLAPQRGMAIFAGVLAGALLRTVAEHHTATIPLKTMIDKEAVVFEGRITEPVRHALDRLVFVVAIDHVDGMESHGAGDAYG